MDSKNPSSDSLTEFVLHAIRLLLRGQVSDTLILSSHKINTVLMAHLGKNFKIDRIGRCLARIAKKNKLQRITTRVPKYILQKNQFALFMKSKHIQKTREPVRH